MKIKRFFMGLLATAVVVSTMAVSAIADGTATTGAALIAGEGRYVDTLPEAFTEAGNPNEKQVLMAKDWKGDININYPGFASSFYINGYTLDGTLTVTDASIINLYGIEPGNDWAGNASIITDGIYQNSTANVNVNGDVTVQSDENGYSLVATAGKIIVYSDNVTFTDNIKVQDEAILKITAGTYNGEFEIDTPTNLEITGGTFTLDPSAYLPAGFRAVKGADDKYTIEAPTGSLDDLTKDADGKYVLSTPTDIVRFRTVMSKENIAAGTEFVLANDINMAGITLAPAGNDSVRFSGIFDGQNHKISNVTIEGGDDSYVAFFGNTSGATIKNLTLENVTVNGGQYTAGIVGRTRNTTVTNCHVIGDIDISGTVSVGAIVGGGVTNITNSSVVGTAGSSIAGQSQVGAVTGLSSAGTTNIENNSVKDVEVTATQGYAGGIAGIALVNANGINLNVSGNAVEEVEVVSGNKYVSAVIVGNTRTDGKGTVSLTDNATKDSTVEINGNVSTDMYGGVEDDENITIPVAKIGTTYYNTLKEAIAAITDGTTITLIATVKDENVKLPAVLNNFTLDANGMTVKNTVINAYDGNSVEYRGFNVINGIFDNSRFVLNGQRGGNVVYEDLVFNNNKFLNIVATGNMAAVHMNVNLEDTEYIKNFTFTNNTIDGVSGSSNSGIVIKSVAGDINISGNTITNVAWNAIQCWFSRDTADIVIENNTLSAGADEGVINLNGVKAATVKNNTVDLKEGQPEIAYFTPVAKIGDKQYTTLVGAIADAKIGDVIDLCGNTVKLPEPSTLLITKDITIENGTLDITNGVWNGDAVIMVKGGTESDFVTLTLNKVDFVGDNYSSAFGVVYVTEYGKAVINECNFELSNERFSGGGVLKGNGVAQSAFDVTKSTFNLENPNRVITNATVALDEVTIDAVVTDKTLVPGDTNNHALRNCVGTIENSKISVDGFETGIKNTDGDLVVSNNSSVVLTNSVVADIVLTAGNDIAVDTTSELLADTSDIADGATIEGVVVKADTVYIQYKKTDIDGTTDTLEGADTYEIILAGGSAEKINELASADLTFNFVGTPYTGAAMTYTVTPAKGVTLTQLGDTDRYMFNYNGVDKYEETGAAIVIGTIEVSGYGMYYLGTDATVTTNAVYATEIRDNIVDGFEAAGDLVINDNEAFDDMEGYYGDIEIVVPTRELTINVDFPNSVENNKYDYQQMKVTVSGGDLDEALVIELGDDYTIDLSAYTDKTGCAATAVFADGAYKVTLTKLLTKDVAYNVEVSGAGYRTARYTVTMQGEDTDGKVLNFWNNVKDNALEVEEDKATSAKTVTYLAGDIVKDSVINIYDLSAVVSYFGETELVGNNNTYAKYDLNRDGKIDSKDVAYVLVSWGK